MTFELGVGDEMGYSCWLFSHESKDPEEFKADCHKAILSVGDTVIANESFSVSVDDWLKAIVPVLESWGYKQIRPTVVSFSTELLNCVDEDSKWRDVIGEVLYEKAVKSSFERVVAYGADTDYFVVIDEEVIIYHTASCPVFRSMWHKQFYDFPKESFATEDFKRYKPCEVCKPEKP